MKIFIDNDLAGLSRRGRHVVFIVLLLSLCCLPAFAAPMAGAAAGKAVLRDVVVTNSSRDLLLYLRVKNAFKSELLTGVQNGLPLIFSFQIKLDMERGTWFNKEIYSGTVKHTLLYDNLKKQYTVITAEKSAAFITNKLSEAERVMGQLNGVKIVPLNVLEPDRHYILKTRVVVEKKSLPFSFSYLIPFSFWNLETDWYSVEFRY
ncbi:DUF4390 domain-containing protein [Desulfobacterota bacterium M19]